MPTLRGTWDAGLRVQKCIGFDATENHRVKGGGGTYAVGNFSICSRKDLPDFRDRYQVLYPLREYGFDRRKCTQVIADAGLPIPPKSACFFCPAMKQIEIRRQAVVDPEFHLLSLEMERIYREGHHFRGDSAWTVRGKRKDTGELEVFECQAVDAADARRQFRLTFNDTARPYRYTLSASAAVPGLGRNFAWKDVV